MTSRYYPGRRAREWIKHPFPGHQRGVRPTDVPIAMARGSGLLAAILMIGHVVAVPLFFLVYFGITDPGYWPSQRPSSWAVTRVLSEMALGIPPYGGVLC